MKITSIKTISSQPETSAESAKLNEDILYKKIELEARSADRGVLDSYEKFILMSAKFLDIPVVR
ncbi:28S ribosomal protein S10, mitochondrial-like protein, partial [Euroglyphus maynei]